VGKKKGQQVDLFKRGGRRCSVRQFYSTDSRGGTEREGVEKAPPFLHFKKRGFGEPERPERGRLEEKDVVGLKRTTFSRQGDKTPASENGGNYP